jgi:B-box zinc finger
MPETNIDEALRCAAHPGTVTYLRCQQCGTPICPRCLVMTPVGAKCPRCAKARRLPTFTLSPLNVVVAVLSGLVGAIVLGVVGSYFVRFVPFASILFPFAAGFALAELISVGVNRKRHPLLKVLAGAAVVLSFLLLGVGVFIVRDPGVLAHPAALTLVLLNGLKDVVVNPFNLLFLILGIWVAVQRIG